MSVDRRAEKENIVVIRNKQANMIAVGRDKKEAWNRAASSVDVMVDMQSQGYYAEVITIVLVAELT